jgi:hypothetical protein
MPASSSPSFIARGDIPPSRFVIQDGSDHGVVVATAGAKAVGVSYEGTRFAPIEDVTPLAAKSGEGINVYTETMPCEIVAGADIVAGAQLKPGTNGVAVPAVEGDHYSAIARASASNGQRVKATVTSGYLPIVST